MCYKIIKSESPAPVRTQSVRAQAKTGYFFFFSWSMPADGNRKAAI